MNKMNLPPPFEEFEEEFPYIKEAYDIEKYKDIFGLTTQSENNEGTFFFYILIIINKYNELV
jgi:hypothetical protein